MDFVRIHIGEMQLLQVEHFFLHKKVLTCIVLQVPFCEEKSVQLVRVAFFRSDFLQNQYFNNFLLFQVEKPTKKHFDSSMTH